MQRIVKSVLVALFAVMCMGALAATSASAVGPLFLTESKKALLVTADVLGEATLKAKSFGVEGTIKCEKGSGQGFVLDKSPLGHEIEVEFFGKCEQTVGTTKGTCTEPIKPKLTYGELGLLNGIVLGLVAPESGTEFVQLQCANGNTKFSGAIVGEFTLNGRDGAKQYGVERKVFLLLLNATGNKQNNQEIELLGVLMTGVHLSTEGFFSGEASVNAVALGLVDGNALIDP